MNNIKFFGYTDGSDLLLELPEISVQGSPDQLRLLGEFILKCSEEMRKNPFWEHEHFSDFCKSIGGAAILLLPVCREKKISTAWMFFLQRDFLVGRRISILLSGSYFCWL